jgi:hypothetical protein
LTRTKTEGRAVVEILQAVYATMEDWAEGIASWPRFFFWLLFFIASGAVINFLF